MPQRGVFGILLGAVVHSSPETEIKIHHDLYSRKLKAMTFKEASGDWFELEL